MMPILDHDQSPYNMVKLNAESKDPELIAHECRIYVPVNQVSMGSGNGLSPIGRQAIIWTSAGLLSIGPLVTNFSEILIKIQIFSFTKMHLKISSAKRRPFVQGDTSNQCKSSNQYFPVSYPQIFARLRINLISFEWVKI